MRWPSRKIACKHPPPSSSRLFGTPGGNGPSTSLANVGDLKKRQRMEFCLAEVCRIRNRCFMQNAQVLVTHIDGKEDRLTMEFSCSGGGNLECLRGVVSVVRQDGTALDKVGAHVEHVHEMFSNFCTDLHGAPPRVDGSMPAATFSRSRGNEWKLKEQVSSGFHPCIHPIQPNYPPHPSIHPITSIYPYIPPSPSHSRPIHLLPSHPSSPGGCSPAHPCIRPISPAHPIPCIHPIPFHPIHFVPSSHPTPPILAPPIRSSIQPPIPPTPCNSIPSIHPNHQSIHSSYPSHPIPFHPSHSYHACIHPF